MKHNYFIGIILLLVITLTGCNDDSSTPTAPKDAGITMGFKVTGTPETEYVLTQKDIMNSEVTVSGTGLETQGWNFFYQVGNTLFVSGYDEAKTCQSYTADANGTIQKGGSFVYDDPIQMFGHSSDNTLFFGLDNFYSGTSAKTLYIVDVSSGQITKKVTVNIDERADEGLTAWATALVQNGDKFFIPYHLVTADGNVGTPEVNTAYVAVYSYDAIINAGSEAVSPEKIITDTRTSHIGTNGHTSSIIRTENGDLYSFSSGFEMAGVYPAATVPSGILKINNGETDFDDNYFLNINELTNGGAIFWFDYVGNNKAIARVLTEDIGGPWAAYGRDVFNQKLVSIDLVAKTVTDVADVPLHAKRYTSPVEKINGKVYVSIETANDAYVYEVDVDNATATKGGKIVGKTIKGFFDLVN
ncbi:DUF4374 domain-containing protein [Flammeovirga pacifica]|uniref:DUF4374 domain-containing protein n=1 Tax=Flammeovirga pacifica TaxID=915059 RepID=A0A1S1Z441_FLAPC|nr:DUF4374 domain-containing protein [Flammeovirga pacifica]OHX67845.1 hypothetical protein NH26_16630 [Flammeovirga pacifica]